MSPFGRNAQFYHIFLLGKTIFSAEFPLCSALTFHKHFRFGNKAWRLCSCVAQRLHGRCVGLLHCMHGGGRWLQFSKSLRR